MMDGQYLAGAAVVRVAVAKKEGGRRNPLPEDCDLPMGADRKSAAEHGGGSSDRALARHIERFTDRWARWRA